MSQSSFKYQATDGAQSPDLREVLPPTLVSF